MRTQPLCRLLLLILAACSRAPSDPAPRAEGDAAVLLGAVSVATAYAYGEIDRVARIDRTGYRARLLVHQSVAGALPAGQPVEITWEELALQRAPRFARGDQVLVALAPLPGTTLWLHRFPPQLRTQAIFLVAAGGDAFLRHLDPASVDAFARYARLAAEQRTGPEGARALAAIVARGEGRLALAAARVLAQTAATAALEDPEVTSALRSVLTHEKPTAVVESVLALVRERDLRVLRDSVLTLAQAGTPFSRPAWEVLVAWRDAAISNQMVATWSRAAEPEWRSLAALAAARLGDPDVLDRLAADSDPPVRQRVAEASARSEDAARVPRLVRMLGDADEGVRHAASIALARCGPVVLPALEASLFSNDSSRAPAAVLALAELGNDGRDLLARAAREHPDERVRTLAALALGKPQAEH